ncbi:MAG: PEP-CTERM sorting domain-containing protein [Planctomycetaceae bacterium]
MLNQCLLTRAGNRAAMLVIIATSVLHLCPVAFGGSSAPFLYATARDQALVDSVTAGGSFALLASGGPMSNVEGVAIDASGNIYVADSPNNANDKVVKITPAGVATTFAAFNTNVSPTGLVFDTSGNLYVATQADHSIRMVTPGGTISTFTSSNLLSRPFGLAFDGFGNLYAANLGNNTVVKVSPAGTQSLFATGGFSNPMGLAFNTLGDLFVSNFGTQRVDRITPAGAVSTFYSGSPLSGPTMGLGVDPNDNVYVATAGNQIVRITPNGSSAAVFSTMSNISGLNGGVQFLALTSPAIVPEPAACAYLLAGLACGFTMWRRRRA